MNEKDELFGYLLENEGIPRQAAVTIPPLAICVVAPLSFAQERFWFLDQFESDRPVYNSCKVERLVGNLDVAILSQSLELVIARHDVLRAAFPSHDGQPVQQLKQLQETTIPITDLQGASATNKTVQELILQECQHPFDLGIGPVFRARLLRLRENEHLLIFTLHQIVFDSRSVAILFHELWSIYEAKLNGKKPVLDELPIQYADFANWQRKHLEGDALRRHLSYWLQQLRGILPILDLPTDNPRPPLQSYNGARRAVRMPQEMTRNLKELAQKRRTTLFVLLLTAFKILLHRYTGAEDLVVGCPVLNRQLPEVEKLIGSFVNTLVIRTPLSSDFAFRQALGLVRQVCLDAYQHQALPFERLIEELHPERDLARNALFQVMFAFQNESAPNLQLEELRSETVEISTGVSKFDLTFSLRETEQELVGYVEYRTDLYNYDTIERMVAHYETLLEAVVGDPDQSIATLPILTEAERHQILVAWNDTAADYPKDKCIHQLFEEQVERTPGAIAVEFADQQITYRELNRRANQLAHYLISLGIGSEKLVGTCVERSIEMVVGLLGILKAGGAYVPLDPAYPEERLRFMLEDAQVSILLTQAKLLEDREPRPEDGDPRSSISPGTLRTHLDPLLQVVCLDRDWPWITQQADDNPRKPVNSNNLAYVIYTSGSAGKPKGVQIEHRSVINCLHSLADRLGLSEHDVLLAVTTISFDISVLELFLPLLTGGRLVVVSRDQAVDGTALAKLLANSRATAMQATPSSWRLLIDTGWEGSPGFKILCGGEALPRDLAEALLKRSEVWNLYGPTESTIWSTVHKVEHGEGPVLIGRPIANTRIYILDSHCQPVPIGVHGDLYIGGDGLARGYWNDPELMAERFIPDPFSDRPNARLYRTGDRARYRPDGNIEFLGRTDTQVKIRGHRIELGEIESVLMQHPAVKETVVVPFDEPASNSDNRKSKTENPKSLVAYVVSHDKPEPTISELREFLKGRLPDYMIPSWFLFFDALPLTSNGKLDRSALPPPDGKRPLLSQGFVEPRTQIEELVAQVWREVLRREKIDVYDNFFDLGGHSLLATRAVARLQSNFQVNLALRKLFELPTVEALAQHIDELRRSGKGMIIAPIVPVPRNGPLPLSSSQRRVWYLHKVDPNLSAYNIPACFHIKGRLNTGALNKALNALIARHEVFRSAMVEHDGQSYQEIVSTLEIALPIIELSHLTTAQAEFEAKRLVSEDARLLHALDNPPLFRAKLVKLAPDEHFLMLNFHHMIADGSSLATFYRELAVLYEAAHANKPLTLSQLPVQYADYAAWQHEWLKSDAFVTQLDYWKSRLAALPPALEIPMDFEPSAAPSNRSARAVRRLSEELTASLKLFSRQNGATVFMMLFATFNILLSRIAGRDDIVIGSTIAGRNRPETDGLVGFFINALPLRTDISGDPSFTILLQRVRDACLEAYTHQEMPFDKIVEELNPPREPGRNPLFDILFNVADVSERALALTGCEVIKLAPHAPEAKFDIVLHAPETDGKIGLAAVYNTALFREARIALLLEQWVTLLDQVTSSPKRPISQLSLLTESCRAALPDPTEMLDDSWEGAIHEMLTEQARLNPESLAVVDPQLSWSYGELDDASNRLANTLIAAGVQPKDTVAIYAERNSSLVVSIFGILKAGATFLILDPAYPPARILDYLRIARPKGWLQLAGGGEPSHELLSFLENATLRCRMSVPHSKKEMLQTWSRYSNNETGIRIEADNPAYVAFTSGSTGEPKGVICRHGPMTHFLPWQKEAFGLTEDDRFAMLSGLAYSHLHRDVFTAIYLGATIYIPSPSRARSPDELANWLEQNAITVLHLTPALGQLLLTGTETRLPSVRRVFFGGDVLTMYEVAQIRHLAPNAIVASFYGATETQRAVGYYEIADDALLDNRPAHKTVPLGQGIKDVQLLVLNKSGQLAGIGEMGEIYVRSPHLARGYIGDPELTTQRFLQNPFTQDPEDRLYRTGELGRYLPDGNLEWAGRNDRRVNIRGFRVELEEIESVLKRHPTIKEAAVVLREFHLPKAEIPLVEHSDNLKSKIENPKSDHLVAYVISTEEDSQSLHDLLYAYISSRLPDYMIPAHFVILSSLPLSPNGKVDYRALPPVRFSAGSAATAPRNDIEVKLRAIFVEVLGCTEIEIDDNFFRVGGHSLLAARAAARIGDAFGVSLALSTFLEAPTVMGLAARVASLISSGQSDTESDKDEREEFDL